MNNDGYGDIIIGAYHMSPGTICVIFGHNSSISYNDVDLASSNFTSNRIGFKVNIQNFISKNVILLYFKEDLLDLLIYR